MLKNTLKVLAILLLVVAAHAQNATTNTTLSVAVSANTTTEWCVASATGIVTPSLSSATQGSILFVDKEAAQVTASGSTSTCFKVKRGQLGTTANAAHSSSATVWVGAPSASSGDTSRPFTGAFVSVRPTGSCTRSQQYTLPVIVTGLLAGAGVGELYDCVGGQWTSGTPQLTTAMPYTAFTTLSVPNAIAINSTSQAAGTTWFSQILIPAQATVTGACILNGATVGTNKYIFALYDSAGTLLANSATAGVTTATASKFQCIAFTATLRVYGPQTYYVAMQSNGTTDNFATYAADSAPTNYGTNNKTGTFGTLTAITPTVTFTANKGPIMMLY